MDENLMNEINAAVDRADKQIERELLERFEEIRYFAEKLNLGNGLTGKGILGSNFHPLIPNAEGITRLVICLFFFHSTGYPSRITTWYIKASAWSMADAGLWDELSSE